MPHFINIFKNDYKKEEKHPDYRGTVELTQAELLALPVDENGKIKMDVALWVKESKKDAGRKYLSGQLEKPRPKKEEDSALNPQ